MIYRVAQLYCDGECQEPLEAHIEENRSAKEQRDFARKMRGWVRVKWNGKLIDLCESCQENHPAMKK